MDKSPRRILMTADAIGGVWSYCLELARSAPWEGLEIYLAAIGAAPSRSQAAELGALANVQLFHNSRKLEWMDDPWEDVERSGEWLLDLEDQFSPDIIHLNGYALGALPFRAAKIIVAHSCVLSWWQAVKGVPAPAERNRYRAAVRDGLNGADAIVAPSHAMLDSLTEFYGPAENSQVIQNGCDPRDFRPGTKDPFILAAGRIWDEAKNIRALETIVSALDWPVYVAGDNTGPDRKDVNHPGAALNCLGKLSRGELAAWCSRASIYALPARYEPFGLSILEAALSRCALVIGDIPSLRELWQDAAVFVSPNDPGHLKSALQYLIRNPDERNALALAAETRARSFSGEKMARSYLNLYSSLMQKRNIQTEELVPCA